MTLRKMRRSRITRKSTLESLERRALLAADGLCPDEDLPVEVDPAVSGPADPSLAPPNPAIFESDFGDFGNTPADAAHLPLVEGFGQAGGVISSGADVDVFELEPVAAHGFVEVIPETPGLALSVTIIDAEGNIIAASESDLPPDGAPGRIAPAISEFELPTDSPFYVSVQSTDQSEGDYSLNVHMDVPGGGEQQHEIDVDSELGDDIHGGSLDATATLLTLEDNFAYVASNIDRDADSDVFQFVAPTEIAQIDAFGELPLVLSVYDSEGTLVSPTSDDPMVPEFPDDVPHPQFAWVPTVVGETYFVSLGSTKGRVGSYELYIHAPEPVPPPTPDSPLGEDAHGDTLAAATELDISDGFAYVISNIDTNDDKDIFQLSLPKGFLIADAFGESPKTLRLLDENGEAVSSEFEGDEPGELGEDHPIEPFLPFLQVEEGTYYLEVAGSIGLYEFNIHLEPEADHGGGSGSTGRGELDAPLGEDIHGDTIDSATQLEFEDGVLGNVTSNIDTAGDRDMFAVEANSNGDEVIFDLVSLSEGVLFDIQILGPNGEAVAGEVFGFGPDGDLTELPPQLLEGFFDPEEDGTHYLSIGAADGMTGSYSLNVFNPPPSNIPGGRPDSELGDDVHGNQLDSATQILSDGFDVVIDSFIDSPGDVDMFVFKPHGELAYFNINSLDGQSVTVDLLDDFGNVFEPVETSTDEPGVSHGGVYEVELGGKYYVRVSSTPEAVGEYELQFSNFPDEPVVLPPDVIRPVEPPEPFLDPDAELGDDVHGDTLETATSLSLLDGHHVEISSNIDQAGDVDAFQISGTGEVFVGEIGGFGATEMLFQVFAEDGDRIAVAHAGGVLEFETLADDNYYITAESEGDDPGQYFVFLNAIPDIACCDPIEPVDPVIDPLPVDPPVDPIEPGLPTDLPIDPIEPGLDPTDSVNNNDGETDEESRGPLRADLDGNGVVEFRDFLVLSSNFGKEVDAAFAEGDVDGDGAIGLSDFLLLSMEFGT